MNKSLHRSQPTPARAIAHACALLLCAYQGPAAAQSTTDWARNVQQLVQPHQIPAGARVEIDVGALDPRLQLAPCTRITPHLAAGTRLWGRIRVGLRCDEGARWNVFVPVTVKVYAQAWSSAQPLPAGTVIEAGHLHQEEVDLAAEASPVVAQPEAAIGRTLVRPLKAGQALRDADLKARQWFAAGDTVRVVSSGAGFAISADGQALGAGLDGQLVKVRIDGGRVVSGRAVAQRRIEVVL